MAQIPPQIPDLTGRKRGWTEIGIQDISVQVDPTYRLLDLAEERRWRLVDIEAYHTDIPPKLNLRGVLTRHLPDHPKVQFLLQRNIPVVRLGNFPHPLDSLVPVVIHDPLRCGHMAAEHMAERGYMHVGFTDWNPERHNRPFYHALLARSKELGISCELLEPDYAELSRIKGTERQLHHRQAVFRRWLSAQPKPMGLVSPLLFFGIRESQWVLDAGLRIPEDVAVLTLSGNRFMSECTQIPLSTIVNHPTDKVVAAVDLLARWIAGEAPKENVVHVAPRGIDIRQSTDNLASPNPTVAEALRFMWDHVHEDLSVTQIARHVGVHRRTLEKAFQQHLQRGINQEFQRRRLEKAAEMIVQSDHSIREIAASMSYSSSSQFIRAFRTVHNMTPAEYRRINAPTTLHT